MCSPYLSSTTGAFSALHTRGCLAQSRPGAYWGF